MKGLSPVVASAFLIVATIGISTALLTTFVSQTNTPLGDAETVTTVSTTCASANVAIRRVALENGNQLSIRVQNTGQRDLGNFTAYANTNKGKLPFDVVLDSSLSQPTKGAVFRLLNSTFSYSFADTIALVSNDCPNAKDETPLVDPSLLGFWKFNGNVNNEVTQRSDRLFGDTRILLHFDENQGTKAYDSTPHGNNGTFLNGTTWTQGISGGAAHFDGVNDYMTIPATLSFATSVGPSSVELWFNADSLPAAPKRIFSDGCFEWGFSQTGSTLSGSVYTATINATNIQQNQWYHAVLTHEHPTGLTNTILKMYVNGALVGQTTWSNVSANGYTDSPYGIAADSCNSGSAFFNGAVDELAVYNRVLTAEDVQEHYDARKALPEDDTEGVEGTSVVFDGMLAYLPVSLPSINTNAGGYNTVAFWMNWNGAEGQMPFAFSSNYDLYLSSGSFGFNTFNGDLWGVSSTGLANQWTHVTAEFYNGNATLSRLYINGVLQTSSQRASPAGSKTATSSARMSGAFNNNYKFKGLIDDVRIYKRALTDQEVKTLYESY